MFSLLKNKTFRLSQGDYIKLGRIRFRIKEFGINNPEEIKPEPPKNETANGENLEIVSKNYFCFILGKIELF